MLSREERKSHNEAFWGLLKKQLRKHMSSTGHRINWLKYPTDINHFYLRLSSNGKESAVHFDVQVRDKEIRHLIWDQLLELKALMESNIHIKASWEMDYMNSEGLEISRISWRLENTNYYHTDDWKKIHAFYIKILIEFDRFYQEYKDILKNLVE